MIFFTFTTVAGDSLTMKKDSSHLEVRTFDQPQLDEYKSQKEFNYQMQKPAELSLWDRFWMWFWEQYYRLMQNTGFRVGFKIFLWALAIGVVLYAVLKIIGMEKVMWLIKGRKEGSLDYSVEQEDIYSINFNEAIEEAISRKNFRLAIRLFYLRLLKELADKELIRWKINKTNIDYSRELSVTIYGQGFDEVTNIYEYAWYGEFEVEEDSFLQIRNVFHQFQQKISR
jgi:Domain of unknown function (DUF4129)